MFVLMYGSYDGYSSEREREIESTRPREFGNAETRAMQGSLSAFPMRLGPYTALVRHTNLRCCLRRRGHSTLIFPARRKPGPACVMSAKISRPGEFYIKSYCEIRCVERVRGAKEKRSRLSETLSSAERTISVLAYIIVGHSGFGLFRGV